MEKLKDNEIIVYKQNNQIFVANSSGKKILVTNQILLDKGIDEIKKHYIKLFNTVNKKGGE